MKQITLNIPDSKFDFFMQLVRSLNFVQIANPTSEYDPTYVATIQKSLQEYDEGEFTSVDKEDLKGFLGLE